MIADRILLIRLLANDALEVAEQNTAEATLMLTEAAVSILLSRLSGAGAREIAGMLADTMIEQVAEITGGANG